MDDWKLWILNDFIKYEVVVNIHDGRPGGEEAYEVQRVSAGLPQQEWEYDKANANSRQADVIKLDCYDLWRILAQRSRARSLQLQPEERKEKAQIMQRILRTDAEIRNLAEPWLNDLAQLIDRNQPQPMH